VCSEVWAFLVVYFNIQFSFKFYIQLTSSLIVSLTIPFLNHWCEQEIATDTCVYKRVIRKPVGEPKDVLKNAATDPSLPRTRSVRCYNCNHPEAAFFQVCIQMLFTCFRCRLRWWLCYVIYTANAKSMLEFVSTLIFIITVRAVTWFIQNYCV